MSEQGVIVWESEHKQRMDRVQTDAGAHSGEPWLLYTEERI